MSKFIFFKQTSRDQYYEKIWCFVIMIATIVSLCYNYYAIT